MKSCCLISSVLLAVTGCSKSSSDAPSAAASTDTSTIVTRASSPVLSTTEHATTERTRTTEPTPGPVWSAAQIEAAKPPPGAVATVSLTNLLTAPSNAVNGVTGAVAKPGWSSRLGQVMGALTNLNAVRPASATGSASVASTSLTNLTSDQISRGLKEALARGLDHAVAQLGKNDGFLTNAAVRIPMPEKLLAIDKLLRRAGQDRLADEFVATMNRAAEKAVPVAAGVFADSLKEMTVSDAQGILQGANDAATQYFRRTAGPKILEKFKPIVAEATSQAGLTAAYKNLTDKVGFAGAFLKQEALDLDEYVAVKASDGLFKMVAEQEAKIRENPVARASDVLKSVFGAMRK